MPRNTQADATLSFWLGLVRESGYLYHIPNCSEVPDTHPPRWPPLTVSSTTCFKAWWGPPKLDKTPLNCHVHRSTVAGISPSTIPWGSIQTVPVTLPFQVHGAEHPPEVP